VTEPEPMPVPVRHYRGKRSFDLVVVAVAAVPVAVVGGVCWLLVRATSRGPALFRQERVGVGGVPFTVLKLRTMTIDDPGGSAFPDEARITKVGRVLRRTSLDELPQLLNVARGEMSIVGPRPTLAYQVARYTPRQRGRLSVRPGVTGLAQVRGRNRLSWPERIELDLEYVERQSLRLDLRVIVESFGVVVKGDGVGGHPLDDPLAAP
jgi:lipopolysaccharide/colanic/teichoic acid biosynthesis glycosyltransferase